MIGYYVHHQGSGHLHRATALAALWGPQMTGLSSLPRPSGWAGEWVRLADDAPADPDADATAHGHLHWVPTGHAGLRGRMAALSAWILAARPTALVSDVSVEVALLARLHGVPVISVVLPGLRRDGAHLLGYGVSDALVAMWPPSADIRTGLPEELNARVRHLGGLSRFPSLSPHTPTAEGRSVTVLWGGGGAGPPTEALRLAGEQSPGWTWTVLGGESWNPNPFAVLSSADVVLTHAGQNAIAETAAARRPALVIPQPRPFSEQHMMAEALRSPSWPTRVCEDLPRRGWLHLLADTARLDGRDWAAWCDDGAAERFARVVHQVSNRVSA